MTKQLKKQFKNQSQSGRSMIEMLGVLAIIAILSIGGIVGYKLAMNYYQADQIANEINLMRNDLKVKYALGNEELLLGDPYDDTPENEHYSGHLSTQYDRYPVDYDCIRKDKAEFYNCREADAYYIKVGNVSKGVCKPLTTLVAAMDGLMYIEINKKVYKEDDLCDENNEFYIQFDAEDVNGNYDSGRPEDWCADDDNCPDDKPFCENERCVECTPETGCESNTQHCENNKCISCPEGKIWSGTACVDCIADTDCADTPDTPICNTDEHICVECTVNEDCLAKGTDEPICNLDTNTCEPCPNEGEVWNDEQHGCAPVICTTNAECFEHLDQNYYCDKTPEGACGENETGICKKFELDLHGLVNGVSIYASTQIYTTYWNGCRICEANAGKDGADCSRNDYLSDYMLNMDFFDCADKFDPSGTDRGGFCHEKAIGNSKKYERDNISHSVQNLREFFGCTRLPDPDKNVCKVSPILAEYNSDHPCDMFRMTMYDIDETTGEFGFCPASTQGGKQHGHNILCKK